MSGAGGATRGFTLLELTVVMVMMGLMAAAAMPALDGLDQTRRAAALAEVRASLRAVRSHALAQGDPTGLRVDPDSETIAKMWIAPGAEPAALYGPLGEPDAPVDLGLRFESAGIASVTLPDGSGGAGVVWFGSDGALELRDEAGAFVGAATDDAVNVLDGGGATTVDHRTGLIR
jgi:prepilin-type N-terminal cleavage/methylation domain-containing protein